MQEHRDHVRTQREGGHLEAKERARRRNQTRFKEHEWETLTKTEEQFVILIFIEVQLIYNIALVSGVQHVIQVFCFFFFADYIPL